MNYWDSVMTIVHSRKKVQISEMINHVYEAKFSPWYIKKTKFFLDVRMPHGGFLWKALEVDVGYFLWIN